MNDAARGEAHASRKASESKRKPYQTPSFRFERAFETMALACGKISPTQKHCQFRRKSS